MEHEFAGEALDGLLNVLVELGGDQLLLQSNSEPVARLGERKLRVTLPETSNATLQTLCGRMATAHAQGGGKASLFTYRSKSHGSFQLEIDGDFAPEALVRIQIGRSAGKTKPSGGPVAPSVDQVPIEAPRPSSQRFAPEPGLGPSLGAAAPTWLDEPEFAKLLRHALDSGATDLHLTDDESPKLRNALGLVNLGGNFEGVSRILTADQARAVAEGKAVDLAATFEARARLRINVFRARAGLCAAIRFLPVRPPAVGGLGLPAEVVGIGELNHGLVLICGTTGSGKSTTLAAMLQERVHARPRHVITLESPIEHVFDAGSHSLVRQREVGQHVTSFAAGLRDALREDPDELVIGEMRDAETIGLALTAAETGHLVWSSLHSRTARSAIERIVDQVSPASQRQVRGQLADSLRAVISQRLIRADGEGARGNSTKGRLVVAAEVLIVTPAVAHLIREGKTEQLNVAVHSGKDAGMLPLEKDLARLVKQGKLTRATARTHADDPALFDRYA